MGNWLFLMLLYVFFGWMKKRQRDKAREKIESQESWDTGDFVEFGEGILDRILGEDGKKKDDCLLYTSPSPRDATLSRMPSSA